jgi:hypothetical protein
MKRHRLVLAGLAVAMTLAWWAQVTVAQSDKVGTKQVKHVLLLSIDGMHAVDLYNCTHGINGANGGDPYCPNLATLTHTGINYVATVSSKPSDSFPGLAALVTGGSPKTTGLYYDVAYDRSLDAPALLTGTGLAAGEGTGLDVTRSTATANFARRSFSPIKAASAMLPRTRTSVFSLLSPYPYTHF